MYTEYGMRSTYSVSSPESGTEAPGQGAGLAGSGTRRSQCGPVVLAFGA